MKIIQKKSSAWIKASVYEMQILVDLHINYNFDFLVLYKMYFQNCFARRSIILDNIRYKDPQYSRPICIRYIWYNTAAHVVNIT